MSTHSGEQHKDEIIALHEQWDETLVEILKRKAKELGVHIPDAPHEKLLQEAPEILEQITRKALTPEQGQRQFVIVSAPSGGGKGTIGALLGEQHFIRMPRVTTREPRPGEVDGVDYIFVDRETFLKMKEDGKFLQTATTHGEFRGASRELFQKYIQEGKRFYIEGSAGAYLEFLAHPDVKASRYLSVFLLPPSFIVLEERLRGRADSITEEEMIERLTMAIAHLQKTQHYPYHTYYVNDTAARAASAIISDFEKD
ncbi:MAG: hypothetical protein WCV86_01300 [Patescibacteria group bacterium]|jgi:guanylate kinase